jgi:hypothetical protein
MRDRVGMTAELRGPLLAPHDDFGESSLQYPEDLLAHAHVGGEEIGAHGQRPDSRRATHHREETLVAIERRSADNRERSGVGTVNDQHVDVPPGPRAVAQPTTGALQHVLRGGCDDIELVPEDRARACGQAIDRADASRDPLIGSKGSGCHDKERDTFARFCKGPILSGNAQLTAAASGMAPPTGVRALESPAATRISVNASIIASVASCGSSRVSSSVSTEIASWST